MKNRRRIGPGRLGPRWLSPGRLGPWRLSSGRQGPGGLGSGRLGPGRLGPFWLWPRSLCPWLLCYRRVGVQIPLILDVLLKLSHKNVIFAVAIVVIGWLRFLLPYSLEAGKV